MDDLEAQDDTATASGRQGTLRVRRGGDYQDRLRTYKIRVDGIEAGYVHALLASGRDGALEPSWVAVTQTDQLAGVREAVDHSATKHIVPAAEAHLCVTFALAHIRLGPSSVCCFMSVAL